MAKTVLITGASSGIGRATAALFQAKGWNVVASMRSPEKETELKDLPRVRIARLDVTDDVTINEAVSDAIDTFGTIDLLVNNAGYGAYGSLEATSLDSIRQQFETNVIGPLAVIKAVLPHLRRQKSGTIVNVSSMGGRFAMPLGSLYHGSKFAVEGFSEALFYELSAIGVQVKIVEPGMTQTDFGGRSFKFSHDEQLTEYGPIVEKTLNAFAALGTTPGTASDVAATIFRAATDGSAQLRYPSGKDAVMMLDARQNDGDDKFLKRVGALFAL
ncbi:SDR family oxidoreductase [Neorhizobium galegae]|uniref:SDR family oxidoreductase n=1 Tax=Neorhizobium galegae TaxID=399 RepID=UPI001F3051A0|nr:SDR family oxidoreductase [Neorhizobium galegae]UIK08601.1 SDR family oxidoreductase [Neorhizobium galegae]